MNLENPAYTQLRREIHDALRVQHPEWILPNGDSPTCDSYDQRFAELLRQLSSPASPAFREAKPDQSNYGFQLCIHAA